jgi:hypothetical protein
LPLDDPARNACEDSQGEAFFADGVSGNRAATGTVAVTDALPSALTATGISGSGWSCDLATLSCTRSDALPAGASYPPITLTVNVTGGAPSSVVNTATVSRSGQNTANDGASDPTAIAAATASGVGGVGGIDIAPPRFLKASMSPRRFKKKGTTFAYTLSEAARVTFGKASRKNRTKKACVRYVKIGSFAQSATAGRNTKKWSGKLGKRALKPGSYRASLTAKDGAGNRSQAKRLSFRIVGR